MPPLRARSEPAERANPRGFPVGSAFRTPSASEPQPAQSCAHQSTESDPERVIEPNEWRSGSCGTQQGRYPDREDAKKEHARNRAEFTGTQNSTDRILPDRSGLPRQIWQPAKQTALRIDTVYLDS